jgi:hypothetical protein
MVGVFILVALFYLVATPCLRQEQQQLLERNKEVQQYQSPIPIPIIPLRDKRTKMGPIKKYVTSICHWLQF